MIAPRFGIILIAIVSYAVTGFNDLKKGIPIVLTAGVTLFFFNKIHELFGISLQNLSYDASDIKLISIIIAVVFFFIITVLFFLQQINSEYEALVNLQKQELVSKNEEIIAQSEEIEVQRDEVTQHRDLLEFQKKEITDSIKYAYRIQTAALPQVEEITNYLPKHFIFFKPRDIVSGDFYWFKNINIKGNSFKVVAVADCTGHGVPGGFVSMLGISFLNEIVLGKKIITPGKILDELRKSIKSSLHQDGSSGEQKDGMDISIYVLDADNKQLEFAGAHNPLYIVRKENNKPCIIEIKADRMPVGIYRKETPFVTKTFQLQNNDILYTFSDGYIDQFGGDSGGKLKTRRFKEIIKEISGVEIKAQQKLLSTHFTNWKGKLDQIDDVLVIGVQV